MGFIVWSVQFFGESIQGYFLFFKGVCGFRGQRVLIQGQILGVRVFVFSKKLIEMFFKVIDKVGFYKELYYIENYFLNRFFFYKILGLRRKCFWGLFGRKELFGLYLGVLVFGEVRCVQIVLFLGLFCSFRYYSLGLGRYDFFEIVLVEEFILLGFFQSCGQKDRSLG